MSKILSINNSQTPFEAIKHLDENHQEYWFARELMPLLGYGNKWQNFKMSIQKAKIACEESKNLINNHFTDASNLASQRPQGGGSVAEDYKLTRYACYLIAMNGDSRKVEVAQAQTYFANQTRKQEILEEMTEHQKRLKIREDVTNNNKRLFETAQNSGVTNFANFNDAGYLGLYGMRNKEIIKKKKLGKDGLLDRAGATELAANLFRITQTDEKLNIENPNSQTQSENIHNMVGGKIRQTIKDIGGTLPENLQPQKHIKEIKKSIEKLITNPSPKAIE